MRYGAPQRPPESRGVTKFQATLVIGSLCVILGLAALSHWQEIQKIAYELRVTVPAKQQEQALAELEAAALRAAQSGSMEEFDRARMEQSAHLLQGGFRPGASAALYFYPETLPVYSLEREFSQQSLLPGIAELREAFDQNRSEQSQQAYSVLESRVLSYEGGSRAKNELLSPEARSFLRAYGHFRRPASLPGRPKE